MDDEGAFPVFEAVLVAVLVLTAVVFVNSLRTPSQAEGSGGIDFGRVAADTLRILEERPAEDPVTYADRLEEMVGLAMHGDTAASEAFMKDLLPDGARYVLRIDNGVEPITLLPHGNGPETHPRAARAAGTLLLPDWTTYAGAGTGCGTIECAAPGGSLTLDIKDSVTSLVGPDGSDTAPDGTTWKTWWVADQTALGSNGKHVPTDVPYGVWDADGVLFRIVHPDGTQTDRPAYGVQLVVWYGA